MSVDKLRESTEKMVGLGDMIVCERANGVRFLDVGTDAPSAMVPFLADKKGRAKGCFASYKPGDQIEKHCHSERETIGIMEGEMEVVTGAKAGTVVPSGKTIEFEPGEDHTVRFNLDTDLWAITMPSSPDYPDLAEGKGG